VIKKQLKKIRLYLPQLLFSPWGMINLVSYLRSKDKVTVKHHPISLTCYVTDRCNLSCRMCLRNDHRLKDLQHSELPDMSYDFFKRILQILNKSVFCIFAGQGEPLLNKEIFAMIKLARDKRKVTGLLTNGTLLDKEKAGEILKSGLNYLNISLYGIDENSFSLATGSPGSTFTEIIQNINNLIKQKTKARSGLKVSISYLCSKNNLMDAEKVLKLGEQIGVDHVYLSNLFPYDFLEQASGKNLIFADDPEVSEALASLAKRFRRIIKFDLPVALKKTEFNRYCSFQYRNISVDAVGNVVGCCKVFNPDERFGNVFKDSDFYNSVHFMRIRRLFLDKTRELPIYCKRCTELSR